MRKIIALFLIVPFIFIFAACGEKTDNMDEEGTIEIIRDRGFNNGFILRGLTPSSSEQTILNYGGKVSSDFSPTWTLAQWGSVFNLKDGGERQVGNYYQYYTNDKNVIYNLKTKTLTLCLDSYAHYGDTPRGMNGTSTNWPHLLVSQNLAAIDRIIDYEMLELTVKFRLNYMDCMMDYQTYIDNLNRYAGQLVFFITVMNKDSTSRDNGKYFWFGATLYDTRWFVEGERYRFEEGTKMIDQGNADKQGTNAFMYVLSGKEIYDDKLPEMDKIYEIKINLLEKIPEALSYIQSLKDSSGKQMYFTNTHLGHMALGSMNTGFEMPGTFNGSVTYYDISIKAKLIE